MADIPRGPESDGPGEVARRLSEARRDGYRISSAALGPLNDLSAAFDLQAQTFAALFDGGQSPATGPAPRVEGWKVATGPQGQPVAAPLHPVLSAETRVILPWRESMLIEVELAFRLRRDLPPRPREAYRRDDLLDAIESVHLGVEIVAGRLREAPGASFLPFLADGLGNAGYIVGEGFDGAMLDDPIIADLVVIARGHSLFCGQGRHPDGDPLRPFLTYANAQTDRLGGLKAGQIVTSGSLCGALAVPAPGDVAVVLHDREVMRWTFDAGG